MSFEIEQVAELARLSLKPEEKSKLKKDLESILAYVEQLRSVPTDKVEPTSHVFDLENVFREDEIRPSEVREEILKHAPHREGNFFKVPKVIDQDTSASAAEPR
jgi:aspartyl-tRNA(Asn)/glutamyl-tRNA(Gln) amidotransferase subunit C